MWVFFKQVSAHSQGATAAVINNRHVPAGGPSSPSTLTQVTSVAPLRALSELQTHEQINKVVVGLNVKNKSY